MIRVLVDSSADFSKEELKEKDVYLVPLQVNFSDGTYLDGINLERDFFYKKLIGGTDFPKTSQPSPQEFVDVFEKVKEAEDELICILLSSALSGTYQSAYLAKDMVGYDKIYIVDSLSAVTGIRILCDHALQMIEAGKPAEAVVEELESLKKRIRIFASVDTLEYLAKGGRVSKAAAAIGEMANIKPAITVSAEGKVEVIGKCLGVKRAVNFIQKKSEEFQIDENYPFYTLFTYGEENCESLEQKLLKKDHEISGRKQLGPTIGSHVGPEAFGLCFIEKEK